MGHRGVNKRRAQSGVMGAAFVGTLLFAGCAEQRPRARPWAASINVRPRAPLPAPGYNPPGIDDSAPDLPWDFAAPSGLLVVRQPARPRVPTQPAPEAITRTEAPSLAPQLSQQEIDAAQQQMNESIAVTERNLATAKSHRLNQTQTDLSAKVNSFLEESKAAAKERDWGRARNLAKKAELLSDELAGSL